MADFFPFIVSGVVIGSIYALAASGLTLTYRTSGIFNFGHGALATIAAYSFYYLHYVHGMNWGLGLLISVGIVGVICGLVLELVARRLSQQQTVYKVVGTVGIILLVSGLGVIAYGPSTTFISDGFFPYSSSYVEIFSTRITYAQLYTVIIALVAVTGLTLFFRFSRMGVATRAVVESPDLVDMMGTNPTRIRRIAWVIGCLFAALSGVLMLTVFGLNATLLTFVVVQAFGAAALGSFASVPLGYLGAMIIGLLTAFTTKYSVQFPFLNGLAGGLPFIMLFLLLLVLPKRRFQISGLHERRPPAVWRAPARVQLLLAIVLLIPCLFLPDMVGARLPYFSVGLTQAIMLLSLGLLVRTAGQVSLASSAFAGLGACVFSILAYSQHMNWFLALFIAALAAIPAGAIVAIPAIRLSGVFLALSTFGFAFLMAQFVFPLKFMFGVPTGRVMPRPGFASTDREFYFVLLAFTAATALLSVGIHRARFGRLLRAVADSPLALSTLGLSTNVTKVTVFCLSAAIASMAGALYGVSVYYATAGDATFQPFYSLVLITILILMPFREPWYALIAFLSAVVPAYLVIGNSLYNQTPNWLNVAFGLAAIVVALQGGPRPLSHKARAYLDRVSAKFGSNRRVITPVEAGHARPRSVLQQGVDAELRPGLEVRDLDVRFGGLAAVRGVSLKAPTGRITGLIGPNGAGKSTLFNACSGLVKPAQGSVILHGRGVTDLSPPRRGRLGLGRTFQQTELCESLTVAQNVALGREASMVGANVGKQIVARRREFSEMQGATSAALGTCGISDIADRQAGLLSTGQRRLVELARCLAGPFDLLLLDEPSAGLDPAETTKFGAILEAAVEERGIGILLVEHDMSLVLEYSSYIYVLDHGELIFEGKPSEVIDSDIVRTAYLGESTTLEGGGATTSQGGEIFAT